MPPMNPGDYILALLQELQRLLSAPLSPSTNHAIRWTRVRDDVGNNRSALVIMRSIGDTLYRYETNPDQITDDPVQTAERLAPAIGAAMKAARESDSGRFFAFNED